MSLQKLYDSLVDKTFRDLIEVSCDICGTKYTTVKRNLYKCLKLNRKLCCSTLCKSQERSIKNNFNPAKAYECIQCSNITYRSLSEITRSKHIFCSSSCAAKYNNTHKTKGTRRSKLEVWLEQELTTTYPKLKIQFNNKTAINSELDIYLPNLNLAFELNGIFHYEPIFGTTKLKSIQTNDSRKFQACLEHNIELCIIDTSQAKAFKPERDIKYLNIIKQIIELKIGANDSI